MKKDLFLNEFMASLVVFFVALPLCMGIALACGVPPEKGLITGIVGGLMVGFIAGSPLQVSGPAAGLVVIVIDVVKEYGIVGLGVVVFFAGVIQLVSGVLKLGQWFRAVSPWVIQGMLSGIGVIIFASQFHVMIDDKREGSTVIGNIISIPEAILKAYDVNSPQHTAAALIGLSTILIIIFWDKFKPAKLKFLPGSLMGIFMASFFAYIGGLSIEFIQLPHDFIGSTFSLPWFDMDFSKIADPGIIVLSLAMALVASAETLLCAVAVDKMHNGVRTQFNKELIAQGIGNMVCGALAALPMTGVIVRSSANIGAGAKTRYSAIMHGAWLLLLVVLLPDLLVLIPTSALAALLVYIGIKLININAIKEIKESGRDNLIIFCITIFSIIIFDLLTGILLGLVAAVFQIAVRLNDLDLVFTKDEKGEHHLSLDGSATFLNLPKLAEVVESLPNDAILHVHLKKLYYIDHACLELLVNWGDQHAATGGKVLIEWDELQQYSQIPSIRKKQNL